MANKNFLDRRYLQTNDSFILDDLKQMEYAKNYNQWIFSLVKPYIGKRVLEIGPGIGNMSRQIISGVDLLAGMEPNVHCAGALKEAFRGSTNFELIPSRIEEYEKEKLVSYHFDTIVCINVLEHIKDDATILATFEQVIENNGRVVLLVPAISQAYGKIDKSVGHFRRYSKSSLNKVFQQTQLHIEAMFYSNFIGLLGWLINARILHIVKQKDTQIEVFDSLVPLLSSVERVIPPPVGLSLISVSRKVT